MRPIPRVAAAGVTVWLLAACSSLTLPLPCDLMIIAVPVDATLQAGDPLPTDPQILAGGSDFDTTRSSITKDADGVNVLNLQLQGAAVGRFAGHTEAHFGEQVAIIINSEVVAVPVVQSSIPTGQLSIIPGAIDNAEFAQRFAGCIRPG